MSELICGQRRWELREVDREADVLSPGHLRRATDEEGVLVPYDRREYVTRGEHDGIPAGTPCIVSRPEGDLILCLEFADGRVVHTTGHAAGIEWRIEHVLRLGRALDELEASELRAAALARSQSSNDERPGR